MSKPLPPEGVRARGPVPTGSRLVLIRHGEAVCNAEGLFGGPLGDTGLTELGRAQAAALAERLASSGELRDAVAHYSSTLPRAEETAAYIQDTVGAGLAAVPVAGFCEIEPGEADGLRFDEFVAQNRFPDWDADPEAELAPGAESWAGFTRRAWAALEECATRHEGELAVVVCHGGIIESAMKLVYGVSAGARLRLRTENCSMTEVEVRDGVWHLLRYNDRAPLPARTS